MIFEQVGLDLIRPIREYTYIFICSTFGEVLNLAEAAFFQKS